MMRRAGGGIVLLACFGFSFLTATNSGMPPHALAATTGAKKHAKIQASPVESNPDWIEYCAKEKDPGDCQAQHRPTPVASEPTEGQQETGVCLGLVVVLSAIFAVFGWFGWAAAEARRRRIEQAKAAYDSALQFLRENPSHPNARQNCLETGRSYYGIIMPNTYTAHYRDGVLSGTSGHQNNAASREARISSDIEAVIGHLKVDQGDRKCPHCAERILAEAKVCKHCGRDVPQEVAPVAKGPSSMREM